MTVFIAAGEPPRAESMTFDPETATWKTVAAPLPGTATGDLALLQRMLTDRAHGDAVRAARAWLETYGSGHAQARSARLVLAEGLFGQREYFKAHEICAQLIAEGSSDKESARAAELEFVVAEVFLSGTKRKWLGMRLASGEDTAIGILDRLAQLQNPPRIGEYALKTKADYYFNRGEFDLADDEYARLLNGFPNSPYAPWVALRRAQTALARFPGTKFDDAALVEAEYRFLRYREQYPDEARVENVDLVLEDIRNTRAQKEFEIAQWYDKVDQERAADFYWRSVINNWPDTVAATQARARLQQVREDDVSDEAAGQPLPGGAAAAPIGARP